MKIIDLDNQTTLPVILSSLEEIAHSCTHHTIELIVTDNETIAALNQEYRGKETPTDVLSFPLENPVDTMPLGSIVISEDFVKEKAKVLGHSEQDELSLLFIHGLLHLLGYDHECDEGEMRAEENRLIRKFDLPSSLIIRTEEF